MPYPETLARSVESSDLMAHDGKIRDVEHVASLAGATSIGTDLMRAKDYDVQALRRCIVAVAKAVRRKLRVGHVPAQLLATAALLEVMAWQCRRCHGAAQQIIAGVLHVCPECEGTGIHRWSDAQRARAAGVDPAAWGTWSRRYEAVVRLVRTHDSLLLPAARARLG